jgi:predicted TIM-barrel fold metal-dependent hydrolase
VGTEVALEPDLLICDAHHHLWDTFELFGKAQHSYLVEDYRRDLHAGHRVEQTVYIEVRSHYREHGPEVMRPVGETEWVVSLDTAGGIAAGIVGFADLRLGDAVEPVLEAHLEAGRGRFRGIRHASAWDASPDIRNSGSNPAEHMFELPEFRRGISALGRMGLSFDAWLFHPQIPELTALARAHPEVTMVLDHLGGPLGIGPYAGHREEVLAGTRRALADLVACENVAVKLGGIGMTILGMGWHKRDRLASSEELVDAWGPLIRWCIETFGPERCLFESNFPVDAHSVDYVSLWNAFKLMTQDLSAGERALLFHDTAARLYRLD